MATEPSASPSMWTNALRTLRSWRRAARSAHMMPPLSTKPRAATAIMTLSRHRLRVAQAQHAFVEDPRRERHQGERVDERRQHAGALIAVGLGLVGRPRCR